ncbi:MAG: hypothetical protein J0H69_11005 [Burkholderiales bacterium]|jgi:hypothetical protein|nr:hypothetical protein [Burkholderiales bacterium]
MAYSKTEIGQRTFKDRSVPLTPRQRSAFILFDGRRSLSEVLEATSGLGVTPEDVIHMLEMGLLEGTPEGTGTSRGPLTQPPPSTLSRPMPLESRPMPLGRSSRPASLEPAGGSRTSSLSFEPVPQEEGRRRYQSAYPLATKLTASLGLRGFRLNLAVEAAGSYEELLEVAPKIRDAVGADKFVPLAAALRGEG